MNTFIKASLVAATLSVTSVAAYAENYATRLVVESGKLEFSTVVVDEEIGAVGGKLEVYRGQVLGLETVAKLGFEIDRIVDTNVVYAEVRSTKDYEFADVYGEFTLGYISADNDFDNGFVGLQTAIGGEKDITDSVGVYGELGYAFNASDDFDALGGYVEIGVPVKYENITLTTSLTQTFDAPVEDTFVQVEAKFTF